jgi:hypothetical protein
MVSIRCVDCVDPILCRPTERETVVGSNEENESDVENVPSPAQLGV